MQTSCQQLNELRECQALILTSISECHYANLVPPKEYLREVEEVVPTVAGGQTLRRVL